MSESLGLSPIGNQNAIALASAKAVYPFTDDYTISVSSSTTSDTVAKTISCGSFTSAILIINAVTVSRSGDITSGYVFIPHAIGPNMAKHSFKVMRENWYLEDSANMARSSGYVIETTSSSIIIYRRLQYASNTSITFNLNGVAAILS